MHEMTRARFTELYRHHADHVFTTCLRMTGDRVKAEELTQDVFIHIWDKRRRFREGGSAGGWVHRVAVNFVLNRLRSERRSRRRLELAAVEPGVTNRGSSRAEDRVTLERAIAGLPERARIVLVLHDVEGYTQAEIAGLMGTSVGTAKAQLHRARHLLREFFDD